METAGSLPLRRHQPRPQRRTEPGRSSGRAGSRWSSVREGEFRCPSLLKTSESIRLRLDEQQQGVLSDSENEEPISRRIRTISAFIRKTSTALSSVGPRSRSCTDPTEDPGKLKILLQPALIDPVGALTAGVLLSSENSRSASVPILPPQRRLAWSAVVPLGQPERSVSALGQSERSVSSLVQSEHSVSALGQTERSSSTLGQSERSVSPDSNDSISEELNHFKPIVCSPCTPPKRLADGRTLQPRVVKATPRNLKELPQSSQASLYHTSAAVLQKWRQIELDRQTVSAATGRGGCGISVATHTSPVADSTTWDDLLFHEEETIRIKVPAIHPQDHRRDGLRFAGSSKRKHKPDVINAKRHCAETNASDATANTHDEHRVDANANTYAQEKADRALALQLQRRFDSEINNSIDTYFLRSTNQSAERADRDKGRGLRSGWSYQSAEREDQGTVRGLRSGRSNQSAERADQDKGRSLRRGRSNQSAERRRSLRSFQPSLK